jgi:hypothetical protein
LYTAAIDQALDKMAATFRCMHGDDPRNVQHFGIPRHPPLPTLDLRFRMKTITNQLPALEEKIDEETVERDHLRSAPKLTVSRADQLKPLLYHVLTCWLRLRIVGGSPGQSLRHILHSEYVDQKRSRSLFQPGANQKTESSEMKSF